MSIRNAYICQNCQCLITVDEAEGPAGPKCVNCNEWMIHYINPSVHPSVNFPPISVLKKALGCLD